MKKMLNWLNKKGISTDAFVIILLIVGLAVAISFLIFFATQGKASGDTLFNLTKGFEEVAPIK